MEEGGVWQIFIDAAPQGWDQLIVRSGYGSSAHYANPLHSFLFDTGFEFPTLPCTSSDFVVVMLWELQSLTFKLMLHNK